MEGIVRHENMPLRNDNSNATVPRKLINLESEVSAAEHGPDEQNRWQRFIAEVAGGRVGHS
jgi:hypothetical protein